MRRLVYKAAARVLLLVLLSLIGGLFSATLVRFAPGYGVDERELDPRLNRASVEAVRNARRIDSSLLSYYRHYLTGAVRGDFGTSQWLERPVSSLIKERLPITLRSVLLGILVAWSAALAISMGGLLFRGILFDLPGTAVSGLLIALPTAVVGMFSVYLRVPAFVAIAVVTFPKLFRYLRNLLVHAQAQPYILAARARGIGPGRVIFTQVFPVAAPALFALLGVSLSMAFGAAIPIEALCDSPGVGQLAWQAALNRDLPLIMNLTLLITLITVAANSLSSVPLEGAK